MFLKRFLKCSLLFILSCNNSTNQLPYYNSPDFEPVFLENINSLEKTITHKIEDFTFTDNNGNSFGSKDLSGKIHVANFIFTSCTHICPKMTTNMVEVEKRFQNNPDVNLVSFTVTPWLDSPEVLNRYKKEFTLNSENWHFLTGDKNKIYSLARKSYFAEEEIGFTKDSTDFLHTEHFLLVDKSLRIRGIYNGTLALEMEQLIEDILLLNK
jgi:protein SCO1/2